MPARTRIEQRKKIMQQEPKSLADIKANPPTVSVSKTEKSEADIAGTKMLLEQYTEDDGFHCPRCGVVIKDPEEAIYHLAEEINKAFESLPK